jgi:hypothetical protein
MTEGDRHTIRHTMMTTNLLRSCVASIGAILILTTSPAMAWPEDDGDVRPPLTGGRPPVAPGQLRPTGELRPVGGGLRPVGGDIRPTGGSLSPVGAGIRPVEVRSPLQDDRSFNARLRPRTPVNGVTGTVVEPGFDNPPWAEGPSAGVGGRESGAGPTYGRVLIPGRPMIENDGPIGIDLSVMGSRSDDAATRPAPSAAYDLEAARAAAIRRSTAAAARSTGDDRGWFDPPATAPGTSARDVRAEVRLAARLAASSAERSENWSAAVDAMRNAVYASPEAFAPGSGGMFSSDPAMQERLRAAIAACGPDAVGRMSAPDAAFMRAALSAAAGDSDAALQAIRQARELGETRPSGKALHRVLSRPRAVEPEAAP